MRFDVDNRDPGKEYAVPPDNPFVGDPNALPEIYAYGWRMPYRCTVDHGDPDTGEGAGRVFCVDVTNIVKEEINILERGGNYGYPLFQGDVCLVDNHTCEAGKLHLCTFKELYTHRAGTQLHVIRVPIFVPWNISSASVWHCHALPCICCCKFSDGRC